MKLRTALLSVTLSLASLALTPTLAFALNSQEIAQKAQSVTVRISHRNAPNQGGSGVIIERNGNEYTVLTNCHVIPAADPSKIDPNLYRLFPYGSNRTGGYEFQSVSECESLKLIPDSPNISWKVDMVILKFNSTEDLAVVNLGEAISTIAENIYVAGYPQLDGRIESQRNFQFDTGKVTRIISEGRQGYELVHDASTRPGMSGGPIFNQQGELVALNGLTRPDLNSLQQDYYGIPVRLYREWQRNNRFSTDEITNSLEQGKRLLAGNDYTGAIEAYNQAIALNPSDVVNYLSRGYAYSELGEAQKAISDFSEAIRLDPNYAAAYNNRGKAYYELKEYQKAITDFTQSVELGNALLHLPYHNRGLAHFQLREYERAISDFNEAIRLNPNFANAYHDRGAVYNRLGETEKAIEDYDQALRLDPNFATAYIGRGAVYDGLGKTEKAIADYDQALRLEPNNFAAYYNRGLAYSELEEYQRAIRDFDEVIRLYPNFAFSYNKRGLAYSELEEYQRAIRDFDEAIRLSPYYAEAYYSRALSYEQSGNRRQAIEDYRRASELYRQQGNTGEWYRRALDNIRRLQ